MFFNQISSVSDDYKVTNNWAKVARINLLATRDCHKRYYLYSLFTNPVNGKEGNSKDQRCSNYVVYVIIDRAKNCSKQKGLQHGVFPGGHPSRY